MTGVNLGSLIKQGLREKEAQRPDGEKGVAQVIEERLANLAEDEQAKLVRWMGNAKVKLLYLQAGIEMYEYAHSWMVLIGTEQSFQQAHDIGVAAYWTYCFWEGRWKRKVRRDRPRSQWTKSFNSFVRSENAKQEDLFQRDIWFDLHSKGPEYGPDRDMVVFCQVESILKKTRNPDKIAAMLDEEAASRIKVEENQCRDLRSNRLWRYADWGR